MRLLFNRYDGKTYEVPETTQDYLQKYGNTYKAAPCETCLARQGEPCHTVSTGKLCPPHAPRKREAASVRKARRRAARASERRRRGVQVISKGRGMGKSLTLFAWVSNGVPVKGYPYWSRVIVTTTEVEAKRLRMEYDLDQNQVISAYSASHGKVALGWDESTQVAVDNADRLLATVLGTMPTAITLSEVSEEEE